MRSSLIKPFVVENGRKFKLKHHDPEDTGSVKSKEAAQRLLGKEVEKLSELQERLYAQDRWALLLIFQGMDASGKDSAVKHVMSGVNPQGCEVYSFKAPSAEELDHDYLWRTTRRLPARGNIGIFNRSYYEEVLIVRVHPEILANQKVPRELVGKNIWRERFEDMNAFERHLSRNGTVVRKFFLNVSKDEQKRRFLARLDDPAKNWKFSILDLQEREHWPQYMRAYEEMIENTSTPEAPWYVVPADHKWFSRLVIASVIVDTLQSLKLKYPTVDAKTRQELATVRAALMKS